MERNHNRGGKPEEDVEIQPALGTSLASQPGPFLTQRIYVNDQKQKGAKHPEAQADRSARLEQVVFGRKGALLRPHDVVAESINENGERRRNGNQVRDP